MTDSEPSYLGIPNRVHLERIQRTAERGSIPARAFQSEVNMIELEDCGRDVLLTFQTFCSYHQTERAVIMVIKGPEGTTALFGSDTNNQCEAIKAFMEEHNDQT